MRRVPTPRRALAPALAVLVFAGVAAPAAFGHAAFLGSSPAPGQRVEATPSRIVLRFSEPLNDRLTQAALRNTANGRRVATRSVVIRGRRIVVTPGAALPRGPYRVTWTTVSTDDGHALEGSFSFGLRAQAAGGATIEQDPLARGGWLRAAVRTAMYVVLLFFCGAILLSALRPGWLVPRALEAEAVGGLEPPAARVRERALVSDAGLFAAGLAAVAAVVEAATAAGSLAPGSLSAFFLSSLTGGARIAVVAFILVTLWLAARRPRIAAVAAVCALGAVVASGHANSASPRGLAILVDWIHLGAGSVWLAGGALVLLVWGRAIRTGGRPARIVIARDVLPGFAAVALPAFLLLVVAGSVRAIIELGSVTALWETGYGVVLLIKIALVAAIAVIAWRHAGRVGPRLALADGDAVSDRDERTHWRLLRWEAGLAVAVLVMAGLLSAFPLPPRQADRAAAAQSGGPVCDPACPLPVAGPGELNVAEQAGSEVVAAWIRRSPGGLRGTVRVFDSRGRPAANPIAVPGAAPLVPCGPGCHRFRTAAATDTLRVRVRERDQWYDAGLPARWERGSRVKARALLARAQATMRGLRSMRETERVSSGPGQRARVDYRLVAPDRLAWRTNLGFENVTVGRRQFTRGPGESWIASPTPGGTPFTTRSWFRWTPYSRTIELLGRRRVAGRETAELALADPATPVWTRLRVDVATGRVTRERLIARARFVDHRFYGFDVPLRIAIPQTAGP